MSKAVRGKERKQKISRRRFCGAGVAILSTGLLAPKSFGLSPTAPVTGQQQGVPTLDDLSTDWLDCSQLAHMPSLHNFHEMGACAPDLVGVNFLPGGQLYRDSGPRWYIYNTLPLCQITVDGKSYDSTSCRWTAYQSMRRAKVDELEIETTNRLVMEDTVVLWRVRFSNTGSIGKKYHVVFHVPGASNTSNGSPEIRGTSEKWKMDAVYRFIDGPAMSGDGSHADWVLDVPAGASRELRFMMQVDEKGKPSTEAKSAIWFEAEWNRAKRIWEERWRAAFAPGNNFFSGNAPLLRTSDAEIREIYYRSVLTLLLLLRTNLWSDRTFITSGERAKGVVFYWDTSLFSTLFAMLEPEQMREQIKLFLEQDPHENAVIIFKTDRPSSPTAIKTLPGWDLRGYAANDLAIFRLTWSYLSVTQDRAFLDERIADQTVLQRLQTLATDWKKLLLKPSDELADYGEASNLLECVPTYIHKVPSFNAANVWMMRELANILEAKGDTVEARSLRDQANTMVGAVMTLYQPGKGVWASLHRDGTRVEMRHCYDFATVGRFMAPDLPPDVRQEMVGFVQRELLTDKWMRAQSLLDVAAADSDRPDHGPMGAYDAWPAVTVDAMCSLGHWKEAVEFLKKTRAAIYEGVYAQAREFYGPGRREPNPPVRIAQRGGCMRECTGGGAFAETIINTLFGFMPRLGGDLRLCDTNAPRGFLGELCNVRYGSSLYEIGASGVGLNLKRQI
jgi:hypothetical protein